MRTSTTALLLLFFSSIALSATSGVQFNNATATQAVVITNAATSISQISAQLNALVNPGGTSTVASFRYGISNTYGQSTTPVGVGSGSNNVAVQQVISGLIPNTTYHFQAAASNGVGPVSGSDLTFKTLPLLPIIVFDSVVVVSGTSARFYTHVNARGATTTTTLEWGTDTTFGHSGTTRTVGADTSSAAVVDSITTFLPNSGLFVRFSATNAGGTAKIGNFSFATPAVAPLAVTVGSNSVTKSGAVLVGTGDGLNSLSYGWFEWNDDNSYSKRTSTQAFSALHGVQTLTATLSNLDNGRTYYFRFVDSSSAGTTRSTGKFLSTLSSTREYGVDTQTVALYHLNERFVGGVQDYVNDANNANSFGTSLVSNAKYGYGRKFNLSGDRIETPHGTTFNFGASNFTLECWVKPNLNGLTDAPLINRGSSSGNSESFKLSVLKSGNVDLMLNGAGTTGGEFHATTTGAEVTDDNWHHIAAVVNHDSSKVFFYVDGQPATASTTGAFPATIFASTEVLFLGADHITEAAPSPNGSPEITLDEVRISKTARSLNDLRGGGGVSGIVFNDLNSDQEYQGTEPGLAGWTILLANLNGGIVGSAITDANGAYAFNNLVDGTYYVKQVQPSGWTQTYPKGLGYWKVTISGGSYSESKNFGNAVPCVYIGPVGGRWSDPANWSCGHAPSHDDDIDIGENTNVDLDDLPADSISTLRIRAHSSITFRSIHHQLKVRGQVKIDSTATLTFPQSDDGTGVICSSDWVNLGTFSPGKSTITFSGNSPKIIIWAGMPAGLSAKNHSRTISGSSLGNQFYNLVIEGDSVTTSGNLTVQNNLTLTHDLSVPAEDTVFILNDSSAAISDTGKIPTGNLVRNIRAGSTGSYRFESGLSSVQFTTSPAYPGTMSQTPATDTIPRAWQLYWEQIGGTVNPANHTVSADHINHFSKWIVGRPGGSIKPLTIPRISAVPTFETGFDTTSAVKRLYTIGVDSHNGSFDATLALRYDPSELGGILSEAGLQLYRGPYVIENLQSGWNLISLPVVPDNAAVGSLFPTAISQAFSYSGAYQVSPNLQSGAGYWLKLPGAIADTVLGNDFETLSIPVSAGWNLIGGLSYETSPAYISSPDGVTFGSVYGYNHGYFVATTFEPLQGYWVKANQSGTLVLTAPPVGKALPKSVQSQFDAMTSISITDAANQTQTLYTGVPEGSQKMSSFELPPSPPAGVLDARFEGNTVAALASTEGTTHHQLFLNSAAYPVIIRWTPGSTPAAGAFVTSHGKSADLSKPGSIKIENSDESVQVWLTPTSSATGSTLPKEFALYQNYPNPFNPQTSIRFDLPQDSRVTISVFNVLGQEAALLANGQQYQAGTHTVSFDASRLASGVYFYTLRAGTFTATSKMVLLR